MAKKLNSMPDYVNRAPHQVHDVSQSFTYTSCPAMILPVFWDMLHHGDKIHFNCSQFSRLNPIVKPALTKLDIHFDYFFVPLPVLFTLQPSMEYGTDDKISSMFEKNNIKTHYPILRFNDMFDAWSAGTGEEPSQWREVLPDASANWDYQTLRGESFESQGKALYRLLNHLEYNPQGVLRAAGRDLTMTKNPNDTPWSLCAYQAIYQLYEGFRNSDREAKDYSYNLDNRYFMDSFYPSLEANDVLPGLFKLRYANHYKDFFNAIKVSPLASSVSLLFGSNNGTPGDYLKAIDNYLDSNAPSLGSSSAQSRLSLGGDATQAFSLRNTRTVESNVASVLTTGMIRSLFAVEKLVRVVGRADKNYESQVLAHFGFKVPHDVLHNITHIGHDMCSLSPSPVISTADTFVGGENAHGSALGEIGGQGSVTLTGKKRHFTAPCNGVFMVVTYSIPRFRYYGTFNPLHGMTERIKFYQPEFDKLGMQPSYTYYRRREDIMTSNRDGWQFRYEQFKRKYDRVTDCFAGPNTNDRINMYESWVLARRPFSGEFSLDWFAFKSHPTDFNTILAVKYNPLWSDDFFTSPHLIYQTDPFINDFTCTCKKVNIMSEFGEPEL